MPMDMDAMIQSYSMVSFFEHDEMMHPGILKRIRKAQFDFWLGPGALPPGAKNGRSGDGGGECEEAESLAALSALSQGRIL